MVQYLEQIKSTNLSAGVIVCMRKGYILFASLFYRRIIIKGETQHFDYDVHMCYQETI